MKKVLKVLKGILLVLVILVVLFFTIPTILEFRPDDRENVEVSDGSSKVQLNEKITVLTMNTGYGALSETEDFFMDGGTTVNAPSKELVEENIAGIANILKENAADINILQEVDRDSKRSFHIDQAEYYKEQLDTDGMFAYNFKVVYAPYPWPTMGEIKSGLFTITDYAADSAERIKLPESFKWPTKTCNLKRCVLVTRFPVEGTDKELVVVNFHLEAYDDGAGKIAQTNILKQILTEEYAEGNYVIAGGDFNQLFDNVENFEMLDESYWTPGTISEADLPEHFSFANSDNAPTCRLLNGPYQYDYTKSQVYIIDGFIVSDNIEVSNVEVKDYDFKYADHNPVKMEIILK